MAQHIPSFARVNDALSPAAVVESIVTGRNFVSLPAELPYSMWTEYTYRQREEQGSLEYGKTPGAIHDTPGIHLHIKPIFRKGKKEHKSPHSYPFYNRGNYDATGELATRRSDRSGSKQASYAKKGMRSMNEYNVPSTGLMVSEK